MITRRNFLKYTVAAGTSLFLMGRVDLGGASAEPALRPAGKRSARYATRILAQIPGGTLDPVNVPKYQTPHADPAGDADGRQDQAARCGKNIDYYEISMKQFEQQILPAGLASRRRCGAMAPVKSASKKGLLIHNAPSLTIEAKWNTPVRIKWIND